MQFSGVNTCLSKSAHSVVANHVGEEKVILACTVADQEIKTGTSSVMVRSRGIKIKS